MSNYPMLRAALELVTWLSRLDTESEMDDRGDCMEGDDAVSTLSEIIKSAREVLSTPDGSTDSGHFYENWKVAGHDEQGRLQVVDSHGTVVALVPCIGDDVSSATAKRENQPEYAERIAACVNFCTDVSSGDLQRQSLVDFRDAAMDVATHWESNRLADYVAHLEGCATDLGAVADEGQDEEEAEE